MHLLICKSRPTSAMEMEYSKSITIFSVVFFRCWFKDIIGQVYLLDALDNNLQINLKRNPNIHRCRKTMVEFTTILQNLLSHVIIKKNKKETSTGCVACNFKSCTLTFRCCLELTSPSCVFPESSSNLVCRSINCINRNKKSKNAKSFSAKKLPTHDIKTQAPYTPKNLTRFKKHRVYLTFHLSKC